MRMGRITRFLFALGILTFVSVSCVTNKSTINDLASLQEELEKDSDSFEEKDWEDFLQRYEELENEMNQREYTTQERKEIRKIQGKITATLAKRSIQGLKKQIQDLPNLIQQTLEETNGFLEGFEEGIKEN